MLNTNFPRLIALLILLILTIEGPKFQLHFINFK